jgi:rRNA-processing protein FCF1
MMVVVCDTNALILPFSHGINIDSELNRLVGEHEIVVPEPLLGELEKLARSDKNATVALKLAMKRRITKANESGDESVLELAEALGGVILSNDREIISRAKASHIKVIRLREGSHLEFDNEWAD